MGARGTAVLDPPAAIDPRIRARRIDVQRRAGRRRLQRLVDLGLLVAVAGAFVGSLWSPLLDVDTIRVHGAARTGSARIREQAGISTGERLIGVDLRAAGRRVATLPWVGQVTMHRGVDGVLSISVTERAPIAALGTGPGALLVDREGRVLGRAADAPGVGALVQLVGVGPAPSEGSFLSREHDELLLLADRVAASAPGVLTTLGGPTLTGQLAVGGAVVFGDTSQLDAKIRSLTTVLAQVDLRCLGVMDLRLPGSPVLTREERCS